MSLQDKINAKVASWAKTPDGKAKISAAKKDALKEGKIFGSGNGSGGAGYGAGTGIVAAADVDFYRDEFLWILRKKISQIPSYYGDGYLGESYDFADEGNINCEGKFNESSGYYEFHFNFDPDSIKRSSLYPKKHTVGAYDIVALINHGYDAKGIVHGYWAPADREVFSLQHREGAFFIQDAVEEFERLYGDVAKISYNEKYDRRG